jgi:hypothetical protein
VGALPVAVPTEVTWALVEAWIEPAALAAERGALVWSLDSDFARLPDLEFVGLFD